MALNNLWYSVFTQEEAMDIYLLLELDTCMGNSLTVNNYCCSCVNVCRLQPHKSIGSDNCHPRVLLHGIEGGFGLTTTCT